MSLYTLFQTILRQLVPNFLELTNYHQSVASRENPKTNPELWAKFSLAVQLPAPVLLISGYKDRDMLISTVISMEHEYLYCELCLGGLIFALHPCGDKDRADAKVIRNIREFVRQN